jgi:DnaJ family protein A protein 5
MPSDRKRDYYEVLGVEQTATATELTKAYRKKALLLHPDKNHHRADDAAEEFKEVQNAYQVLNDAEERAWYDAHKEQILSGKPEGGTTAPDEVNLFEYCNGSCYRGYSDEKGGFYDVYRSLFELILKEDSKYQKFNEPPPAFGGPDTPYREVQQFYQYWLSYSTRKTFAWKDEFKPSEFPDRFQRRAAERHNEKERATARSEYNHTLRFLVNYVKRKDPRVKAEQERVDKLREEKEEARDLQQAEAIRKRQGERKAMLAEAAADEDAWAESQEDRERQLQELYEAQAAAVAKREAEEAEERRQEAEMHAAVQGSLRCDACKKSFKTERLMSEHVASAKHKTKVKQLIAKGDLPEGWVPGNTAASGGADDDSDDDHDDQPNASAAVPSAQPVANAGVATADTASDDGGDTKSKKKKDKKRAAQHHDVTPAAPAATAPVATPSAEADTTSDQGAETKSKQSHKKDKEQKRAAQQADIMEALRVKAEKTAPKKGTKGKGKKGDDDDDDEPVEVHVKSAAKAKHAAVAAAKKAEAPPPAAAAGPSEPAPAGPAKGKATKKGKRHGDSSDDEKPAGNDLAAEIAAAMEGAGKGGKAKAPSGKKPAAKGKPSAADESSSDSSEEDDGPRGGGFAALAKGKRR